MKPKRTRQGKKANFFVEVWVMKSGLPIQRLKHLTRNFASEDGAKEYARQWNINHVPADPKETLYEQASVKQFAPRVVAKGEL